MNVSMRRGFVGVIFVVAVAAIALAFVGAAEADTIGYWRFEDSPGFLEDSGLNDLDLSTGGSPVPTQSTLPTPPATGPGLKFDDPIPQTGDANAKAASFAGAGRLTHADASAFEVSDFTIEAYIHNATTSNVRWIAGQWLYPGQRSWQFGIHQDDMLISWLSDSGSDFLAPYSDIIIDRNKDYYVAMSFDEDGDLTYYAQNLTDGFAMQTETVSHTVESLHNSTADFVIGQGTYEGVRGGDFIGLIDEVRLSNTVLSEGELLAVPEPSSLVLLGLGGLSLAAYAWRRRRRR